MIKKIFWTENINLPLIFIEFFPSNFAPNRFRDPKDFFRFYRKKFFKNSCEKVDFFLGLEIDWDKTETNKNLKISVRFRKIWAKFPPLVFMAQIEPFLLFLRTSYGQHGMVGVAAVPVADHEEVDGPALAGLCPRLALDRVEEDDVAGKL
jgi:hypothetical protein